MPPAGQAEDAFRLEQRARGCFERIFKESPEGVTIGAGRATIVHMDEEFTYEPEEDALYYQPLDTDGNPYGRRVEIRTIQQAVHAIQGRGGVDSSY